MEKTKTKRLIGRMTEGLLTAVMVITLMPGTIGMAKEAIAPGFQSAKNYGGAGTDSFLDVAYTRDGGFVGPKSKCVLQILRKLLFAHLFLMLFVKTGHIIFAIIMKDLLTKLGNLMTVVK